MIREPRGRKVGLPKDALVNVTWRCNSRCVMCDAWKRPRGDELAPHEYSRLPRSMRFINISGGEPFLRDDLPEVLRVIDRSVAPEISISTNGFARDRIGHQMREILRLRANVRVMISIDGIGRRHDTVRGFDGAFDKAMGTVEDLKRLGLRKVGLAYVTTDRNVDQLLPVMRLARQMKLDFTVCGTAHNSQIAFSQSNPPISNLEELERGYETYVREELKSYSINRWGRAYSNSGTPYYARTGKRQVPCHAGSAFFFMTPNGDVYPDMVLAYRLGNIMDQAFEEIWYSRRAEDFRRSIEEVGCCSTPCWMLCTVYPWMKMHRVECAAWLVRNKVRAHLGLPVKAIQ